MEPGRYSHHPHQSMMSYDYHSDHSAAGLSGVFDAAFSSAAAGGPSNPSSAASRRLYGYDSLPPLAQVHLKTSDRMVRVLSAGQPGDVRLGGFAGLSVFPIST